MSFTRTFTAEPRAVEAARRFVREELANYPAATRDAVELMVSELATNCVRHARSDFELVLSLDGRIRVEVSDSGDGEPHAMSPSPKDPNGRGLMIVEALSERWGVQARLSGKMVWFELAGASTTDGGSGQARRGSGRGRTLSLLMAMSGAPARFA